MSKESLVLSIVIELILKDNMFTENSEPDLNIPLTSEPEKQATEGNNIDIMCAKLGQQQVENLNLLTQNLANHLNVFLNRLEEANKDKSIPVTDAKPVSNHAPRPLPIMGILKVLPPRPLPIMEMRTIKRRHINTP